MLTCIADILLSSVLPTQRPMASLIPAMGPMMVTAKPSAHCMYWPYREAPRPAPLARKDGRSYLLWSATRRQACAEVLRVQLRLPARLLQLHGARLVVQLLEAPTAAHPDLRMPVRSGHAHRCWGWIHHLVLPVGLPRLFYVLRAVIYVMIWAMFAIFCWLQHWVATWVYCSYNLLFL